MITSFLLVLSFTSDLGNKEEYVVDHGLTKQDCIERMNEEIKDSEHESNNQMYKDAVERYNDAQSVEQPVKMDGIIVEAFYSCVKA